MNDTPAQILYRLAGRPDCRKPVDDIAGRCAVCGNQADLTTATSKVLTTSFTDHDALRVPMSPRLCCACTWAMTGRPPVTMRLWTWLYRTDKSLPASHPKCVHDWVKSPATACNKADVSAIWDLLLDPPKSPWFASIADSGQLHVLPFAGVNRGRAWTVRFDRVDIASTSYEFGRILHAAATLYAGGFIKEDILTGRPHPSKLVKHGISLWRDNWRGLAPLQGSELLRLSVWLLRKDTVDEIRRRTDNGRD